MTIPSQINFCRVSFRYILLTSWIMWCLRIVILHVKTITAGTSAVWNFFKSGGGLSKTRESSTSNLLRHLRINHAVQYATLKACATTLDSPTFSSLPSRAPLLELQYTAYYMKWTPSGNNRRYQHVFTSFSKAHLQDTIAVCTTFCLDILNAFNSIDCSGRIATACESQAATVSYRQHYTR